MFHPLRRHLFEHAEDYTVKPVEKYQSENKLKIHSWKWSNEPYDPKHHTILFDYVSNQYFKSELGMEHKMGAPLTTVKNLQTEAIVPVDSILIAEGSVFVCQYTETQWIYAIFPEQIDDEDYLWWCLYSTYTLHEYRLRSREEYDKVAYPPTFSKHIHWLWFRKPGKSLDPHIVPRATTWITMNPELTFHLWTNLDSAELDEFFRGHEAFVKRVQVHTRSEMYSTICRWAPDLFMKILEDWDHPATLILKTDITRLLILLEHGGWYADFNDTICLTPLKYLVSPNNRLYFGTCSNTDELTNNNYLIYADREDPMIHEKVKGMFEVLDPLYTFLCEWPTIDYIQTCLKRMATFALQCPEKSITQAIYRTIPKWIHVYTSIYLPTIPTKLHTLYTITPSNLLSMMYMYWHHCAPSETCETWLDEMQNISSFAGGRIRWKKGVKDPKETYSTPRKEEDLKRLLEVLESELTSEQITYLTLRFVNANMGSIMTLTNIGTQLYDVPVARTIGNCYPYAGYGFLTSILHLHDASSAGSRGTISPIGSLEKLDATF